MPAACMWHPPRGTACAWGPACAPCTQAKMLAPHIGVMLGAGHATLDVTAVVRKFARSDGLPVVPHRCTGAAACKRPLIQKKRLFALTSYSLARHIRSQHLLLLPGGVLAQACALLPAGQAGWRACTSPGSASPPSCSARLRSSSTPAAPLRRDSQQSSAAVQTWECSFCRSSGFQHTEHSAAFLLSTACTAAPLPRNALEIISHALSLHFTYHALLTAMPGVTNNACYKRTLIHICCFSLTM